MEDECLGLAVGVGGAGEPCRRCSRIRGRRRRLQVLRGPHMTALLPLLVLLSTICRATSAMCPTRCQCNDLELHASCTAAGLQVVPIQLNPELRHINLSHNRISDVHFTLDIYANLITLDVSFNRIQKLGAMNFMSQKHMSILNVSNNEIESLDKDVFKGMKALTVLDVSSNHLEDISKSAFIELSHLEVLLLQDNRLVSFEPELFKHQSKLQVLQLDDNQLLEIPADNLVHTPKLERLSMSRNLVEFIEEESIPNLNSLKVLALDSNVISDIHGSAFDGFSALETLNLADNNFTSVPTAQLSKLSNLLELNLSGNFFSSVPPVAFRGLFKLRILHLNAVETLTRIDVRAFVDNINLESVSMNDNIALDTIPTRLFHGNPRVKHIFMQNNMFQSFEATHFPLDQLTVLQIGDNPLHCNCSIMWLWKLVTEQKSPRLWHDSTEPQNITTENPPLSSSTKQPIEILLLDVEGIRCSGPEPLSGSLLSSAPESEIRCSPTWMAVATISGTIMFVIAVILVGIFYSGLLNRCTSRRSSKGKNYDSAPTYPGDPVAPPNRQLDRDKCEHMMISPPLLSEYQTLPPWDPFSGTKDSIDLYRQFGYHTGGGPHSSRPHVVYV